MAILPMPPSAWVVGIPHVDYVDILKELIEDWKIANVTDLNETGEKARDYIMKLPDRLLRVAERMKNPMLEYKFTWID